VSLLVRDTGHGIPDEILDRVFEPFFTTKEAGKGTGLGLATILGIAQQHGGSVDIRNRTGGGCDVELLLPCIQRSAGDLPSLDPGHPRELVQGEGETVVLVEDDDMVRELVQRLLAKNGYGVRAFESGQACRDALLQQPEPADILLTDVVMPGLNGPDLRDRLHADGLKLPALFMSGYAGDTLIRRGLADARADFLQKPVAPETLLRKLRKMIAS
jgi:CheY-like chemotaxis protein